MTNAELDLTRPPGGVEFPATLESPAGGDDAALNMIPFPFCLLFAGNPWITMTVAAPSPEDAATTMGQFVQQVVNPTLARMGYPADVCAARAGACPTV
jgi:hypothetical protein